MQKLVVEANKVHYAELSDSYFDWRSAPEFLDWYAPRFARRSYLPLPA